MKCGTAPHFAQASSLRRVRPREGISKSESPEPGWRAEKRKPVVPQSSRLAAGASRRANRGVNSASGPAFVQEVGSNSTPVASASSWQGLVVASGGAPMPPGCLTCAAKPAGAAPRPASTHASRSALQVDEVMRSLREVLRSRITPIARRSLHANKPHGWQLASRTRDECSVMPPRVAGISDLAPAAVCHKQASGLPAARGQLLG